MLEENQPKPSSPFRNPLLYTFTLLVLALVYVGYIFLARRQDAREIDRRAAERRREADRQIVEAMGGDRFEILSFYAYPGAVRRGEDVQLCYGVSNAKSVKLDPPEKPVWPSSSNCVKVTPLRDTTYTLTIENGKGNSRTASLTVHVE